MSTLTNQRAGNFTSSEIWKLMTSGKSGGFGKPALTYIQEKQFERKLGRTLNVRKDTRATLWGNFLEQRVYDMLPTTYELIGQKYDKSIFHTQIDNWCGKPDLLNRKQNVVADIKCPEPKAFCELVENLSKGKESFKTEHPEYFWQLVSNAILTYSSEIELIVYLPYESELPEIRESAQDYDDDEIWKYRFIYEVDKSELAYQPNESEYSNLNFFRFVNIESEKAELTERVKQASEILNGIY